MNKSRCIVLSLVGMLISLAGHAQNITVKQYTTPSGAVIRHYETEGNLAVTHDLKCTSLDEVKNTYTPSDLYRAYADCVQKNNYKDATELFMVAGAYARFDALRVTDKSAHQARTALIMNASSSMSEQQRNEWKAYLDKYTPESQEAAEACGKIKRIGPPDYYPAYMIQHGIKAFLKEKTDPIVPDFDPQNAWQTVLDKGLHCH